MWTLPVFLVFLPCVLSLTCWFQNQTELIKQDCIPVVHNTCATLTIVGVKDGKSSNSITKSCSNDLMGCNVLCSEAIKLLKLFDPSFNVTSCNAQCFHGDLSNASWSAKASWIVILALLFFAIII